MKGKHFPRIVGAVMLSVVLLVAALAQGQQPDKVEAVLLAVEGSSITATWSEVAGAERYELELRDDTSTATPADNVTARTYTIGFLTPGVEYTVRVRAIIGTSEGPWSDAVTATAGINKVTGLALEPGHEQIIATWDGVPGATGYEVEWWRKGDPGDPDDIDNSPASFLFAVVEDPTYTIPNLDNGIDYTVRVAARAVGDGISSVYGEYSDTDFVAPVPSMLAAPQNVQVVPGRSGELIVTWDPVEDATGYEIYWEDSAGDGGDKAVTGTTHTIDGVVNGTSYSIYVFATADSGMVAGLDSETVSGIPRTPLVKVTGLQVYSADESLVVDWDEVEGAERYQLQRRTALNPTWLTRHTTDPPPYTWDNLTNGLTYEIRVRAKADGSSTIGEWSEVATGTAGCPALARVENLRLRQRRNSLIASWKPLSGSTCNVLYEVQYRLTATQGWSSTGGPTELAKVRIWNLTNGIGHDVRVRAVQPLADDEFDRGPWSYVETATPRDWRARLDAPEITSVVVGNRRVTLTWEPLEAAAYYEVYRIRVGGSVGTNIEGIDTVEYVLLGLTAGMKYRVKVRGIRAPGTAPGPWSESYIVTPSGTS